MKKTKDDWIKEKTADLEGVGTIPEEFAAICWDVRRTRDFSGPVRDMHVVDFRKTETDGTLECRVWNAAGSTAGACLSDWGISPRHTPLGKFAELCFDGKMPKGEDFVRLLKQFAQIEGCEWAVHMLAALHMGDILSPTGEEWNL